MCIEKMEFALTEHPNHALKNRSIDTQWVIETLKEPDLRLLDPNDVNLERFYRKIPDRADRVLRVVVNTRLAPWRIVSVFFDRRMKGKL